MRGVIAFLQHVIQQRTIVLRIINTICKVLLYCLGASANEREWRAQLVAGVSDKRLLLLPGLLGRADRTARQPPAAHPQRYYADLTRRRHRGPPQYYVVHVATGAQLGAPTVRHLRSGECASSLYGYVWFSDLSHEDRDVLKVLSKDFVLFVSFVVEALRYPEPS